MDKNEKKLNKNTLYLATEETLDGTREKTRYGKYECFIIR